ncbi:ExbD/TolR family protein [Rhodosalinus sp. FB01]|uniref:ExbD/TolR family protein n=1 Tax=Rhodosalinus sp. FB01 TaxID=3239194 RepID=UPI0035240A92
MEFSRPPARTRPEAIVPMINVVFLLLIFFLMTAEIAPPAPFDVTPPQAGAETGAEAGAVLHVSAAGRVAFGGAEGAAAWEALAARDAGAGPLTVRADATLPAAEFAALLRRLAETGAAEIELAVRPR